MTAIIKFQNIKKSYHTGNIVFEALKGVSFEIQKGEWVAIVGPSGSGKTTTMQILGLLSRATCGQYFLDGVDTAQFSGNELAAFRNKRLGFIFQHFFLLPKLSALENVMLPLTYRHHEHLTHHDIKNRALKMLAKVGMEKWQAHRPNELSGGQQQRVAIARALIGSPSIILADEPTGALDSKTAKEVMNLFSHHLNSSQATIVIITHSEKIAAQCHREIRLHDGLIQANEE